jgi:hypothetical protein
MNAPYTPRLGSILVSPSIADARSGQEVEMACFSSGSSSKKRKRLDHTIFREDSEGVLVGDFPQNDSNRQCSDDSTSSIPDELQEGGGKSRHLAAARQGSPSKDLSLNSTVQPSDISLKSTEFTTHLAAFEESDSYESRAPNIAGGSRGKSLSWAIEMARLSYLVNIVNYSGQDLVYKDSQRDYNVTRKGVPIKVRIIAWGPSGREVRVVPRMAANDNLLEVEFRKNMDLAVFIEELNTQSRFKLMVHDRYLDCEANISQLNVRLNV